MTQNKDDTFHKDLEVDDMQVDDLHTLDNDVEVLGSPLKDMSFKTIDEAREYYEEYGRKKGFWIRGRSSSRGRIKTNEVTRVVFVCSKEGNHVPKINKVDDVEGNEKSAEKANKRSRNCSTARCGCKAKFRIVYDELNSNWKVTVFNDTHNHPFVSPSKRMKMRSNKQMPNAMKSLTEVFHSENMKVSKVPSIFGGEHMGVGNRDCYNHLRDVRHRNLDCGDAQSVLNYFKNKQAQNPQFFYAIQCDENGRATNFFWVDSRSRMAYQYFGDVVTFDTTYRTNKYDMPFAPFTGVNHHWQSIQFGCALLQDETEVTFTWLFETWLEAMGGRPPIAFLTDQDLAMKGAIAKVFPNTRHRLCIWHIKKKFGEKLSQIYQKKSKFKKEFKKCIKFTYKKEDFEERWMSLMNAYGLESNEWLQQMYKIRELWVPVYNRGTFFAGMNTTGRSEGINSFFNDFVTPTTNLKEFMGKYEQALKRIVQRESDEDFESEHKFRIVKDNEYLLKHAAKLFTRNIFNKFKIEMNEALNYKVEEQVDADGSKSFMVTSKVQEYQKFIVMLDPKTKKGTCECQNFEFVGILCRHILKVLFRLDIDEIPDHFILPRWMQKANKFRITDSKNLVHDDGNGESEVLRLGHLCQESTKLACLAATSSEGYKIYIKGLNNISKELADIRSNVAPIIHEKNDLHSSESTQLLLLDPNISQTKGRKKDAKSKDVNVQANDKYANVQTERLRSGIELSSDKKRKCRLCKGFGHDSRNCPRNSTSKSSED